MQILIDGHNLIGQMPDISLADPDDEARLVAVLRRYAARTRHKLTVVFDGGLPRGPSHELSGGGVKVIFAPAGQPADPFIIRRLARVRDQSGWMLVSSDQEIVKVARQRRLAVKRSEVFASELANVTFKRENRQLDPSQVAPSEAEVEAWLREFAGNK